jgi:hypothetical protein
VSCRYKASEASLSLQPVNFPLKETLDPSTQLQFGLVSEQVAKFDPRGLCLMKKGKPSSGRYEK